VTRIISAAIDILAKEPQGLRMAELTQERLAKALPDIKTGRHYILMGYVKQPGAMIYQPARGWFKHVEFQDTSDVSVVSKPSAPPLHEAAFYQPFADYLRENLQECTKAIVVGGSKLKDKFGTPDVVGVFAPSATDVIEFPVEVVSAEIKVSTDSLITAFGQVCSYRLFSHKCYIAVPKTTGADIDRLESLCMIFGIGLILFDPASPLAPNFEVRTRAVRHEPDMFYVNDKIRYIAKELLD